MENFESYQAIIEFGILKERQANRFYMAMSQRVADKQLAQLFEELAAEELEHREKLEFELMKIGIVVDTSPDTEEINTEEYIISDLPELDLDGRDMIELAIAKEDAAYRLYVGMVSKAATKESKEALMEMAQEELRHKIRFENARDRLLGLE